MNGGKRLRASLVMAAARLASSQTQNHNPEPAIAVAAAVEMLHAYSLIHDDLPAMDDAELRRGKPACHIAFDEATAILAGDALQTQAFALLCDPHFDMTADRKLILIQLLCQASGQAGMAGGQMLDLQAEMSDFSPEQMQYMQQLKTGALIQAAAVMGVVAGGGPVQMTEHVRAYANHLGLAFQIADDVLDYEGVAEQLGKPARRDAEQGKASFVELLGLEGARQKAAELVTDACSNLDIYGASAGELQSLAHFVINRNS